MSAARASVAAGLLAALALGAGAIPAKAQTRDCVARVDHLDVVIAAGTVSADDASLRERLLGWPGRQWDRARGTPPACDSAVTIAFHGAILALDDAENMCLARDPADHGYILVPGTRNYRGRCARTACERVNMLRDDGFALAASIGGLVTGREIDSPTDGLAAVAQSTGAMLLTGQSGFLIEALGQGATALGSALSAPAVATAAAVTVVAVGGVVYVCHD